METIKVLGIHSSPVKDGNTASLTQYALQAAAVDPGVATEMIALAGLAIGDCNHCNWCMRKQTPEKLCSIEDDASEILKKIRDCDILVLATPVYFTRLSGRMACLIDRTRCFTFGRQGHTALRDKVGVAIAVGWLRNFGIESTLQSLHNAFLLHEMWTPAVHHAGVACGVGAMAGKLGDDGTFSDRKRAVMDDAWALSATTQLMKKAVETSRMLKGRQA
ncbi:MAG: flavodoxin family protein [Deltaproteobacteria bacterium HGW-Deltaproteobacteria-19]|jgi:multimeric flavodoxin WrbA|nr:MAG: flavodoxin family protein [Deltaproteobacteria bacterium HGW-Deltaproteobacteria-19]